MPDYLGADPCADNCPWAAWAKEREWETCGREGYCTSRKCYQDKCDLLERLKGEGWHVDKETAKTLWDKGPGWLVWIGERE